MVVFYRELMKGEGEGEPQLEHIKSRERSRSVVSAGERQVAPDGAKTGSEFKNSLRV